MAFPVENQTPRSAVPITPSNTFKYNDATGGEITSLYIGGAGNVAVTTSNGEVVTFSAIPAGTTIPIKCSKVMLTNTTATLILGLRYY